MWEDESQQSFFFQQLLKTLRRITKLSVTLLLYEIRFEENKSGCGEKMLDV